MKTNLTNHEIVLINGGVNQCLCVCKRHLDAPEIVFPIGLKINSDICREDCCLNRHFFDYECKDVDQISGVEFMRSGSSVGSALTTAAASTQLPFKGDDRFL